MAEKFLVVRHTRMRNSKDQYVDAYEIIGQPLTSAAEARGEVHKRAVGLPGVAFTYIKVIGHAVADIVRDVEP